MNNLFIIVLIFSTITFTACGQNSDVPSKVKTAFKNKVSNANDVEWEFDKEDNLWEAEYETGTTEYTSSFTKEGNWRETEHKIKLDDLPNSVKKTLKSDFSEYEIEEVEYVKTPKGEFYEVEIELEKNNKDIEYELLIKPNGEVTKKVEEKDDENEE